MKIERDLTQFNYKFGVLLCMEGQVTEEEMLQNNEHPPEFVEFLSYLGKTVQLKGHEGFSGVSPLTFSLSVLTSFFSVYHILPSLSASFCLSGGLDTKYGDTGETSVYATHQGIQIMYHVSTMLPYNPKDVQQIARKKHIGNDVVVFIFMMGVTPFDPSTFVSEFNHVFIAVRRVNEGYHVNVVSRVRALLSPYTYDYTHPLTHTHPPTHTHSQTHTPFIHKIARVFESFVCIF